MRTFHAGRDDLHGFTVVVETTRAVHVGRCDDIREGRVVLLDAESHEGQPGGREAFLARVARTGPWPRQGRLVIAAADVVSLRRLGGPPSLSVDTRAGA